MKNSTRMSVIIFIALIITGFLIGFFLIPQPKRATAPVVTNFRTERRLAAKVLPVSRPESSKVATRALAPVKVVYFEISAYSPSVAETDGNPTRTASGKRVYVGGIAADLRVLPFGSKVIIPGYNNGLPCTVTDTGGAIHGNKLDVFVWSAHEAIHWGRRRRVPVRILYIPRR